MNEPRYVPMRHAAVFKMSHSEHVKLIITARDYSLIYSFIFGFNIFAKLGTKFCVVKLILV